MIAVAPAPQPPAGDPWESFAALLADESSELHRLNAAAIAVTATLVDGSPAQIADADARLNSARATYLAACSKRRGMQVRGFGEMTLRHVCTYAPRRVQRHLFARLAELSYGSVALGITLGNNKSLISAGLERLVKITGKLQEHASERTGVYKRRGYVAPPKASVIVSSHV